MKFHTPIGKARDALSKVAKTLDKISASPALAAALSQASLQEEVDAAKSNVTYVTATLRRTDKLFEVEADEALKGNTDYAGRQELKDFINANLGGDSTVDQRK